MTQMAQDRREYTLQSNEMSQQLNGFGRMEEEWSENGNKEKKVMPNSHLDPMGEKNCPEEVGFSEETLCIIRRLSFSIQSGKESPHQVTPFI